MLNVRSQYFQAGASIAMSPMKLLLNAKGGETQMTRMEGKKSSNVGQVSRVEMQ